LKKKKNRDYDRKVTVPRRDFGDNNNSDNNTERCRTK